MGKVIIHCIIGLPHPNNCQKVNGRSCWLRSSDLYFPKVALYQAELNSVLNWGDQRDSNSRLAGSQPAVLPTELWPPSEINPSCDPPAAFAHLFPSGNRSSIVPTCVRFSRGVEPRGCFFFCIAGDRLHPSPLFRSPAESRTTCEVEPLTPFLFAVTTVSGEDRTSLKFKPHGRSGLLGFPNVR